MWVAVTRASCKRASLSAMTRCASARAFSVFLRTLVSSANLKIAHIKVSAFTGKKVNLALSHNLFIQSI